MFRRHQGHHHKTAVVSAGVVGLMLGFAGAFALAYPDENRAKTENFLQRTKDRLSELFEIEEVQPRKIRKKTNRKLIL